MCVPRPDASTAFFSAADLERIRSHPAVERVDFSRAVRLQLDPLRAQVTLTVRPIDAANPGATLPLTGASAPWNEGMPPPIWISEPMVDIYGMRVGQVVQLPLAGRAESFTVAGVWRDYARQFGAVAMRMSDYRSLTGDNTVTDAAVWLKPGAVPSRVIAELRTQIESPAVEFAEIGEIRQISLRIFDRSFAVTYVLEIAAIVIGLVGIAATFSSQAIARTREFGMLRHIGLTRRQILADARVGRRAADGAGDRSGSGNRARRVAGADQRDQPAVFQLDDGLQCTPRTDRRVDGGADDGSSRHRRAGRKARGFDRCRARGQPGLVMVSRRAMLLATAALASGRTHAQVQYPSVVPRPLIFPRDHGAHPDYRTEWWYMTGWLDGAPPIGFQITFFRTRTPIDAENPSPFAAKQLVIAHAAIADPAREHAAS